jgi:DNA-binding NtrC family response regulator
MQNIIERAVIFAEDDVIKTTDIGLIGTKVMSLGEEHESLHIAVKAYEKEHICRVLNRYEWNKVEAAKALNVGLSSLYRKIDELEIITSKRSKRECVA